MNIPFPWGFALDIALGVCYHGLVHIEEVLDNSIILDRLSSDANILNQIDDREAEPCETESSEISDETALSLIDKSLNPEKPENKNTRRYSTNQRIAIGTMGKILGTEGAANIFDTSSYSPSVYQRGKTRVDQVDGYYAELTEGVKRNIAHIREKTSAKLLSTLDLIDDKKLSEIKTAREAVHVATGLSKIISNTEPREEEAKVNNTFFIHVPSMAKEEDYEVIDV